MSESLLYSKRNRLVFAAGFLVLIALQIQILIKLGFGWNLAIWDSAVSNFLLALACTIITNAMRFYMPGKNKYAVFIAWSLALAGFCLLITKWLLRAILEKHTDYIQFLNTSASLRFWIAALIISWVAIMNLLWNNQRRSAETDKRKLDAEKLAREAELYKLRQQLQPHFLFNSLNSINALITTHPEQARKMIQQLSDFLRGTLKKEEHQWVKLADELEQLHLYLDIEKVRFGHRLNAEIMTDDHVTELELPPMLLQPLVENAIKFGLYDTTGDITIQIFIKTEERFLVITVINPFDPETSSPLQGTGFGLSSLKRRLYLLFARNDLLITSAKNNLYTTIVKIPMHDQGNIS